MNSTMLEHSPNAREEIQWINMAKGIAMFMVVLGHCGNSYFYTTLYYIHLPIFIVISGYLLGYSCEWKKKSLKENVGHKASTLIFPYIVFGAVFVGYNLIRLWITGEDICKKNIYIFRMFCC